MSRLLQLIIFFLFFFISCFITYPLITHLGTVSIGLGDELVITWIMQWVIHAFSSGNFLSFFQANTYYPFHNSLAYSDLHLITSFIGYFPYLLLREPIVVFNSSFIISLALLGWSIYLLSLQVTKNYMISFFVGILVIFSPAVLDKMTHIQILAIQWVPLSMLFFLKYLDSLKQRHLFFSLCFFLIQTYNSFLPGYFLLFFYGITLSFTFFWHKEKFLKIVHWKNALLFFVFSLLLLPIIIPYYQVSKEFNYTRDIRDSIHFALQPEDLLYASHHSRLAPFLNTLPFNLHSKNDEFKPGYIGFIFSVLAIISFVYWIKQKKKDAMLTLFSTVSLTGLLVSLGPIVHLGRQTIHDPFPIPLPYLLFYYVLPGFQGFRNSARWEMLFIICIAVSIAIVLTKLLKKVSKKKQLVILSLLFFGIIIEYNFPLHFEKVPQRKDFPKIHAWLTTTPKDTAVIFMPIYNWNMAYPQEEMKREYFSIAHFRRMVNGYSGFSPPPWQSLVTILQQEFPNTNTVNRIKDLGVDYLIIDKQMYDKGFKEKNEKVTGSFIINELKKNPSLLFIKQLDEYYIFKF